MKNEISYPYYVGYLLYTACLYIKIIHDLPIRVNKKA